MELKQLFGSLFILGFSGDTLSPGSPIVRDLEKRGLGGVILFDRCLHSPEQQANITSPGQLKELTDSLRECGGHDLFICVDQEGGLVQRLNPKNGFTATASAAEMGSAQDGLEFVRKQAEQTANNLHSAGINVNFAPVVDLDINRQNPVIGALGRSFSDNPEVVADRAVTWIREHASRNILCCLKHFPGHGSSSRDSHLGFVDISSCWQERELEPYRAVLARQQVDMVMAGHLFHTDLDPDFPATLSQPIITGLLRDTLGFDGLVVTDDMQMKAITDRHELPEAICRCFAAGVDLVVIGNNLAHDPDILDRAYASVQDGLRNGLVSEQRLYSALQRVSDAKNRMRLNNHAG